MIPIAYNVGSIAVRRTTTATAMLGIALVVFVLASALMLSAGIRKTMGSTGKPDVGMVIRKGSDSELSSNIEQTNVSVILAAPGVKKGDDGRPLGVGEMIVVAAMEKVGIKGGISNVQIRGVPDGVLRFRPGVRFVAGHMPRPGSNEAAVGARIRGRFVGLEMGQSFELRKNRPVEIVGVFEDDGSSFESEVWVDLDTGRAAFNRTEIVSSVRAQLESASAFDAFAAAIEQDKRLGLEAQRESTYYEKQSKGTAWFVGALGGITAFFFSLGAMIGAMITMYASVSSRQREIGTLRALGFSRRSVLASFMLESVLIAFLGGIVGCVASLAMGFVKFSMMNFASWSEIVFSFHPTPVILGWAMIAAILMGLVGGFLPAMRAALLSPIDAMRGE